MNWPIPSPEPVVFEVTPITVVVEETAYFSVPENARCAHVVFALPLLFLMAMTMSLVLCRARAPAEARVVTVAEAVAVRKPDAEA